MRHLLSKLLSFEMSIFKYFKPCSKKADQLSSQIELVDPCGSLSLQMPSLSIAAANKAVMQRSPGGSWSKATVC